MESSWSWEYWSLGPNLEGEPGAGTKKKSHLGARQHRGAASLGAFVCRAQALIGSL